MVEVKSKSEDSAGPGAARQLSVGEVARRAGVTTSALRFYEANGLITSSRTDAGHRRYLADTLRRVGFIRVAQRVGLTLAEIRSALEARDLAEAAPEFGAEPKTSEEIHAVIRPAQ